MSDFERPIPADDGRQEQPQQPYQQQPGNAAPVPPPPPGPASATPHPVPQPYPVAQQQPYPSGQPYGSGQPYASAPQPPYPAAPQPPYPQQPPYPAAPQPPKKKVWPWVLGGCLLMFVLGIGGCVSCVSCAMIADRVGQSHESTYDYTYSYPESDNADSYEGFTLNDIKESAGDLPGKTEDGRCTSGVFEVGSGKDIEPGLYFLEGSADAESNYYVFDYDSDTDSYALDDSVVYFGNYFTELEPGDVVAYLPSDDSSRMYAASKADFKPEAPYGPGTYRVGTDIPAGTYAITVDATAAKAAGHDCGAYVMKDLEFDDGSITDSKFVVAGGSQTITVKDGDYLELYATTATAL